MSKENLIKIAANQCIMVIGLIASEIEIAVMPTKPLSGLLAILLGIAIIAAMASAIAAIKLIRE